MRIAVEVSAWVSPDARLVAERVKTAAQEALADSWWPGRLK